MTVRLKLVLLAGLSLLNVCLGGHPSEHIHLGATTGDAHLPRIERACTVDELLPLSSTSKSSEWASDHPVDPAYNCSCATIKGRYFCPSQDGVEYPTWVPQAASQGLCTSTPRSAMAERALPPNMKVLIYGNSHFRQVMEGMMCMFQGALTSKTVSYELKNNPHTVSGDMQCRTCWNKLDLLNHGCVDQGYTCECNDDHGEFFFENGAVVHFSFSDGSHTKSLNEARNAHRNDELASYDVVFANQGNPPRLLPAQAVEMALQAQEAGAKFFWLSCYDGGGDIGKWSEPNRASFSESGAKYVDVGSMMQGMNDWTIGAVKNSPDDHFCMPGPSDEVAVLLTQLMWALHEEG